MMIDSKRLLSQIADAMTEVARDPRYGERNESRLMAYSHVIDMIDQETAAKDNGFDAAWDLWGYKANKVAAKRAWKRLSRSTRQQVMDHIPRFKAALPEWHSLPLFSSYLNGRRWEDEDLPSEIKTDLRLMTYDEALRHAQQVGKPFSPILYQPVSQPNSNKPLWKYTGA